MKQQQRRVAFLVHSFEGGGIQKAVLNLLQVLNQYDHIILDLVIADATGPYLENIPARVNLINLNIKVEFRTKSLLPLVPAIARYLRAERPDIMLSFLPYVNVLSILAKRLSWSSVRLIIVEQTLLVDRVFQLEFASSKGEKKPPQKLNLMPILVSQLARWFYPQADSIVSVSQASARELEANLNMKMGSIHVIYNPVIDEELIHQSNASLDHPWLQPDQPPVFLAVGRLAAQKDYETLLRAFAQFCQQRSARLMILGDGELRSRLESVVKELNLENNVALPGFAANPHAYMKQAKALILSSVWETLGMVLIEAMACGCQVIATDCPQGPGEVLDQGKYGWLVPVGDVSAIATAMQAALDAPIHPDTLRHRAQDFSVAKATSEYLNLLQLEQHNLNF